MQSFLPFLLYSPLSLVLECLTLEYNPLVISQVCTFKAVSLTIDLSVVLTVLTVALLTVLYHNIFTPDKVQPHLYIEHKTATKIK